MGASELKTALRRAGEERIRGFWKEAESAVSARRKEVDTELVQLRAETDRQLTIDVSNLRNNQLFTAQTKAMESRLHAEAKLEQRLLLLAQQMLRELAAGQPGLWQVLYAELPQADWRHLTVHPADRSRVETDFPEAVIDCDESLGGGMIATSGDGTFRVDNSLLCRLLRAWPDLLPRLLAELRKRVDEDEAARINTTG